MLYLCGFYAMRSRKRVERLLEGWKDTQTGAEAWALGQVTLTGRVIEFELGWRGEYAYPYALTVFSDNPELALELRREYLVDVESAPALSACEETGQDASAALSDDDLLATIDSISARLEQVRARVPEPATGKSDFNRRLNLRRSINDFTADRDAMVSAVADAIEWGKAEWLEQVEGWRRQEAEGGPPVSSYMKHPPLPVASSRDVAEILELRINSDGDRMPIRPEYVVSVANALRQLWYGGFVSHLRFRTSPLSMWLPGSVRDEEVEALNASTGCRKAYCMVARVVDKHAAEDEATVRAIYRRTKGTGFVRGSALLASFAKKQRPRNMQALGHSLVRCQWRGVVDWRYLAGESGPKTWGLTDAGLAQAVSS